MKQALTKVFGDPQARTIKRLTKKVAQINERAEYYRGMKVPELKKQTEVLKKRLEKKGTTLDDVLVDAFALVREASDRALGMRHFDVQLIGGMALHDGEMPLRQLGLGSKRMLTTGLQKNSLRAPHITLFDEVELGLEPHRVARLVHPPG